MWAGILAALQIVAMVLKWWFSLDDAKKAKAKELLTEAKNAQDASAISRIFDAVNRM